MSERPGPSSVHDLLGSLLSNMATAGSNMATGQPSNMATGSNMAGQPASSPLGDFLSSLGQPQPSGSLLSPSTSSTEVAHPPISPSLLLGSLLSSLGQPSGSLLSTSLLPPSSTSTEVAHPPISPLLLGAGRLLLQNWQPIMQVRSSIVIISTPLSSTQAGKALASAGGALGGAGTVATVTGAAGAGLVTAGVAR